jgi:hypothetical protein
MTLKKNDQLFQVLNWINKKQGDIDLEENLPSTFMINRWLSMGSKSNALIVNSTLNRWNNKSEIFNDALKSFKFLKILLPYSSSRLNYIKKKSIKEETDLEIQAGFQECSVKEIINNQKTLAHLNKNVNNKHDS